MLNTKYLTSIRSLRLSNQARKRNTHQNWRRSKMVTNCRSHNTILLLLSRLVVSNSMRPHRQQPTRLPCPWDSPGKNTGMGCHFLLQCMKVKVKLLCRVWLFTTPWTAAHQAPSSMGFSRQEYWSEVPLLSPTQYYRKL